MKAPSYTRSTVKNGWSAMITIQLCQQWMKVFWTFGSPSYIILIFEKKNKKKKEGRKKEEPFTKIVLFWVKKWCHYPIFMLYWTIISISISHIKCFIILNFKWIFLWILSVNWTAKETNFLYYAMFFLHPYFQWGTIAFLQIDAASNQKPTLRERNSVKPASLIPSLIGSTKPLAWSVLSLSRTPRSSSFCFRQSFTCEVRCVSRHNSQAMKFGMIE